MARIAHGGFMHETNCFVPMRTDYEYYAKGGENPPLARGEEIFDRLTGNSFGTSGFLDEMRDKHELVPLIWGAGGVGGYVTDDAFERIVGELVGRLSQAMPVDAVYLELHGAMCSLTYEDAEGEVLRRVRATIGPPRPRTRLVKVPRSTSSLAGSTPSRVTSRLRAGSRSRSLPTGSSRQPGGRFQAVR